MNDGDRTLLKRAARDMILDTLVDSGDPLDSVPDAKLAQLFDEVVAYRPPMEKKASAEPAPLTEEQLLMQKAAELSYLGRVAARVYVQARADGIKKLAINLETLKTKIRGITPEEAMGRERSKREMELELGPRETEARQKSQEVSTQGQQMKDIERMRAIQLKDLTEQQNLAESLRQLQLGDQFARRQREAQLFRELHGQEPFGKMKAMIGGGLLGFAGRRALMAAAAAGMPTALKLAPLAGRMTGVGAALGLGAHLLGADRPSRSLTRLERERYMPGSMSADVAV